MCIKPYLFLFKIEFRVIVVLDVQEKITKDVICLSIFKLITSEDVSFDKLKIFR
jgi:hypothetical protein